MFVMERLERVLREEKSALKALGEQRTRRKKSSGGTFCGC